MLLKSLRGKAQVKKKKHAAVAVACAAAAFITDATVTAEFEDAAASQGKRAYTPVQENRAGLLYISHHWRAARSSKSVPLR